MQKDEDPNQLDPWAASIRSGTAPKPKAKPKAGSWGSFKPGESALPEELSSKPKTGGGRSGRGGKSKAIPSGPYLARRRVTPRKITGQVLEWKGKYGWIQPTAPLQHPKAQKHNGKIYISWTDLKGGSKSLDAGCLCDFFVFEDDAGLGAEECGLVEESTIPSGRAGAASIAQSGGSLSSSYRGTEDWQSGRGKGSGGKGTKGKAGAPKAGGRGIDAFGGSRQGGLHSGFGPPDLNELQAGVSQALPGHLSDEAAFARGSKGGRGRGRGSSGKQNASTLGSIPTSNPFQPPAGGGRDPFANARFPLPAPPYPDMYTAPATSLSSGRHELPQNLYEPSGLLSQLPPGSGLGDPASTDGNRYPGPSYANPETDIWGCGGLGLQGFSGFGEYPTQMPPQSALFGPMI